MSTPLSHAAEAHDVWSIDFKGHCQLGNGRACYPLTVTDNAIRYVLSCRGLYEPRRGPVQATLHLPALPPPASGMLPTAPAPVPTLPPTSAQRSPLNRPTPLPLPAQPPASPQPDNGSPPPVDSPPRNPNPTLM